MARQKVEQVQCDRCKRIELQPVTEAKKATAFEANYQGDKIVYDDLCVRCNEALKNVWEDVKQWERPVKQELFKGPQLSDNQAAPSTPSPDFSPPRPHSNAAGKR